MKIEIKDINSNAVFKHLQEWTKIVETQNDPIFADPMEFDWLPGIQFTGLKLVQSEDPWNEDDLSFKFTCDSYQKVLNCEVGNKIMTEFVNYKNKSNLIQQEFDKSFDRLIMVYNLALKTVKELVNDPKIKDIYLNQDFVKKRRLLWSSLNSNVKYVNLFV